MGERKTPQEKRCGSAKKRSLSNYSFYGRKSEDFRSHSTDKIRSQKRFAFDGADQLSPRELQDFSLRSSCQAHCACASGCGSQPKSWDQQSSSGHNFLASRVKGGLRCAT